MRYTNLEELEYVKADVEIGESRIEDFEVDVLDTLHDETWNFGRGVADDVE
jgi:hypothetical protein